MEDLLGTIGVGILIQDANRTVVWANATHRNYFGAAPVVGDEIRIGDRWFEHRSQPITTGRYAGGSIETLYDVTHRKHIQDSMQAGEVGVFEWNLETGVVSVDPCLETILGFGPGEMGGQIDRWLEVVHPDDANMVWNLAVEHLNNRTPRFEVVYRVIHRDGRVLWFLSHATASRDETGRAYRLSGTATNITDHKAAEQSLRLSLEEKETLLQEVHHRVKNNLQIISSLLHMQAKHLQDEEARNLILESESRIRSMALVHEMLYTSNGLASVDFGDYVSRLAESLRVSFGSRAAHVELSIEVDDIGLNLDTAVHLGLILNEVISNAFKHAFPEGRSGHLSVRLEASSGGIHLSVRDDGVGLPTGFDAETAGTLGVQLVRAVSSQLGASVDFETNGGTVVRISVPSAGGA